jgi:hypothetical protein
MGGETSAVLGKGILVIRPQDFLHQLSMMKVTNAPNIDQSPEEEASLDGSSLQCSLKSTENFSGWRWMYNVPHRGWLAWQEE